MTATRTATAASPTTADPAATPAAPQPGLATSVHQGTPNSSPMSTTITAASSRGRAKCGLAVVSAVIEPRPFHLETR